MRLTLLLALLAISPLAFAATCPGQVKNESALLQNEQNWALALERHDAQAVGCLLADEFEDADPSGQLHDRTETLADVAKRKPGSNQLSEMRAHIYGDFGYVRGLATLVDPQGKTVARVRFTDVYAYRDGRWVCLAGHESMLPEATK